MKVRHQLTILLCLLACFTAALVSAVFFFGARGILYQQIQSTVLSVATTAAATQGLDLDAHERIQQPEDVTGGDYQEIQKTLRTVRDANRKDGLPVRFLYTMRLLENGDWIFVVDAEEKGPNFSKPGDRVKMEGSHPWRLNTAMSRQPLLKMNLAYG